MIDVESSRKVDVPVDIECLEVEVTLVGLHAPPAGHVIAPHIENVLEVLPTDAAADIEGRAIGPAAGTGKGAVAVEL